MFSKNTLFVVGAGASKEAGLPIGSKLAADISRLLTYRFDFSNLKYGDPVFLQALRQEVRDQTAVNQHLAAAAQIASGVCRVESIDRYIDTHRDDARIAACGKAAIVYSILAAERSSLIHTKRDTGGRDMLDFGILKDTWFTHFGRLMVDQVPAGSIESVFSNLRIICFNYDRCIEEFLAHWLASVYAIDLENSRRLVERLPILRPYGQVAELRSPNRCTGIVFGEYANRVPFFRLSQGIKTFTEQIEDGNLIERVRAAVAEAETIVFLGFGFHAPNLRLITPHAPSKATRVFASARGFSDTDAEHIRVSINRMLRGSPSVRGVRPERKIHVRNDLTCAGIFTEFQRSLSFD